MLSKSPSFKASSPASNMKLCCKYNFASWNLKTPARRGGSLHGTFSKTVVWSDGNLRVASSNMASELAPCSCEHRTWKTLLFLCFFVHVRGSEEGKGGSDRATFHAAFHRSKQSFGGHCPLGRGRRKRRGDIPRKHLIRYTEQELIFIYTEESKQLQLRRGGSEPLFHEVIKKEKKLNMISF